MEYWKKIEGYDFIEISSMGNCRSLDRYVDCVSRSGKKFQRKFKGRTLKKWKTGDGYIRYSLTDGKMYLAHRIVALAFLKNDKNLPQVDHINEKKEDNRVENLQWISVSDNNIKTKGREIIQYDKNMNFIKTWNTIKEAGEFYQTSHIQECCSLKRNVKTVRGFIWRYKN